MGKKKREEKLEITFAQPGDEEDIANLIAALAEYEKAPEENKSTPATVREQIFGEHPSAEVLMARIGGKAVGFALFFPSFSTWLCRPGMYLEDLFVYPEFRGRGIARTLLERLAAICVERNYGALRVELPGMERTREGFLPPARRAPPRGNGACGASRAKASGTLPARKWSRRRSRRKHCPPLLSRRQRDNGEVVVYTDGGCRPNPGVGAWAAVLKYRGKYKELSGGDMETTNNRMEMLAAINALESLRRRCKVVIHTDSQYLKNGITTWIHGWKKKNWRKKDGEPVLNAELWRRLDDLMGKHDVRWSWVRGHAGNEMNERCDSLCSAEIDRLWKLKHK